MANEEQLSILKQGTKVWNEWGEKNPDIEIDLRETALSRVALRGANLNGANLSGADLSGANLSGADLSGTDLSRANLSGAHLREANLSGADLFGANLRGAHLREANLSRADLREANLSRDHLFGAHPSRANLIGANLSGADLRGANLSGANLSGTDLNSADLNSADLNSADLRKAKFTNATMLATVLASVDLSSAIGLPDVNHKGPSTIGTDTLINSKGKIPEKFLKGCGLSDWEIESAKLYQPDLRNDEIVKIQYRIYDLRATQAIQLSPLFISYSHQDSEFVNQIDQSLTNKGIRFWRDIHDMKAGRMEKQIDQAIRQNPTVLLILSKDSLESDWVEHEVRMARGLEKEMKRDVLCPVALDDSWKSGRWPARVMEQIKEYNILDFSDWQNESTFGKTFNKLVDGLGLFYK